MKQQLNITSLTPMMKRWRSSVTSQHVTLLLISLYKFAIGNFNYQVQTRLDNLVWL